mgnify:CR=1 FL=1|tara:strand:+ start:10148 stop:11161 length:1014 start_codon:yes stop_codon:yes gene_type:complete
MGKKKLKKVELIIDEQEERFGVEAISLVEFPAIEENWVFFNKDQFLTLAKLDEEQKTLVGAVLIPNKEIPRYDQEADEKYIVYFTEETIKQAQELFMASLRNNNATYEHRVPVEGMTVVESWIKEDKKNDKSNAFGFNKLPIGTWFVKMKVNNPEIWDSVKEGKVRGFSIEGYFTDKLIEASRPKDIIDLAEKCTDCPDEITLGKIRDLILENELAVVGALDGEPLFATKEEAKIYAEMFKGCDGFHTHNVDGVVRYMACNNHEESTKQEYIEDEFGKKKKKYTRKYKYVEYAGFVNRQALAKYPWDQCIRDMVKEYGNKETAAKVCSAIKNRTAKR